MHAISTGAYRSPMLAKLDNTLGAVVDAMSSPGTRNPKLQHLLQLWSDLEQVRQVILDGNEATAKAMVEIIYSDYAARRA